ncbi:Ribosome biogenesis protein brx1 [Tieghemiomyces parasiticus]|uniref:Ribosome biogenesis protein brx1 n=1 Tax=Tieghemiomyces parasiticus TaxID=78921 RepID=A0A9W8DN17_9FUNG|nr:Ribosome biogenesis protein brx1 [Tieghemiomyces parasiticus]
MAPAVAAKQASKPKSKAPKSKAKPASKPAVAQPTSDDEVEETSEPTEETAVVETGGTSSSTVRNKQRVLLLATSGITYRQRHLLQDLATLLPHAKKDIKFNSRRKSSFFQLNAMAEANNCNNILFFEPRKNRDLYMWLARAPNGPSIKFEVFNLHTMDELNMTGNCLRGSRPVLSFDAHFDSTPEYQLMKQVITRIFNVPKNTRRSKPFIDHVFSFTMLDGKIWFRNYQIVEEDPTAAKHMSKKHKDQARAPTLVEIGPRFVLAPIRILEGSFCGQALYRNREYQTPAFLQKTRNQANRDSSNQRRASHDDDDHMEEDVEEGDDMQDDSEEEE